ncbi:MAG: DMT family transporter [Muribaculum sp.]|nr:DMT family transporter [Muribaculum sp.]
MKRLMNPRIMLIISMTVFGTLGLFVRNISVSSGELALYRAILATLLIVGLVHTGVTYCLYFSSLKELPGQKAAILSYIDPLVAVLVSVLLLGEGMSALQVLGGILILGFTLWNEIK